MATTIATSQLSVNIRTSGSYPLRLGDFSHQKSSQDSYTAIRYNHKPKITHVDDTTNSIVSSEGNGGIVLSLKDGDDEYAYNGIVAEEEHTYILLADDHDDGYTLEKLGTEHDYNLISAPWESDAKKLSGEYTQLNAVGQIGSNGAFDTRVYDNVDDEDGAPDTDNPFDFRHYLDTSVMTSPGPGRPHGIYAEALNISRPASRQATPLAKPARKPGSAFAPQQRASKKKHPADQSQARHDRKRAKISGDGEVTDNKDVPTVRLDRAASIRVPPRQKPGPATRPVEDITLDEDSCFILDGDASAFHGRKSLGLALSGQLGDGPISLKSAASSPTSRVNSPAPTRPAHLGRKTSMDESSALHQSPDEMATVDPGSDADADGELDDDVDALQLPSPAQAHRPSVSGTVVTAEDDDDLEKQMLMAMELDEEDGPAPNAANEVAPSDEESEEE